MTLLWAMATIMEIMVGKITVAEYLYLDNTRQFAAIGVCWG